VLASELKPLGIHLTIVEPGYLRTNFLAGSFPQRTGRAIEAYAALVSKDQTAVILGVERRKPFHDKIPEYLANSNLRFQQWILDTCLRPYDQDWINYQQEIALRHTSLKKNKVDAVRSTPYVPLRDLIAFIAVMNETIKPYLAAKGNSLKRSTRCIAHGASQSSYN